MSIIKKVQLKRLKARLQQCQMFVNKHDCIVCMDLLLVHTAHLCSLSDNKLVLECSIGNALIPTVLKLLSLTMRSKREFGMRY